MLIAICFVHYLGLSSYALYIIHQPVKNYFYVLEQENNITKFIMYIGSVLILSAVCHKYIEEYFRKIIVRRIMNR